MDDRDCWQNILAGDQQALEVLYKRYFSSLYLYGLKLARREDLAEDTIHDLFLKVWNKHQNLNEVTRIKTYLFRAYRNLLIDRINLEIKLTGNARHSVEMATGNIEDIIIENEYNCHRLHRMNDRINLLPPRQREILYLRFYRGFSIKEIADILEINNQSVRNSLFSSLTKLKKWLLVSLVVAGIW